MYLFLGGASAGAYLVMSCWSLAFHRKSAQHNERLRRSFNALRKRCYVLCLLLMVASVLCLFWDLGSPERVLLLFISPRLTLITLGAFALAAELLVGLLLVLVHLFKIPRVGSGGRRLLEASCAVLACMIMAYTGVFLASGSIPFWDTGVLVALFVLSSFSSGVSLVLLVDWLAQGQTLLLRSVRPLQKTHVACLVAEAAAVAAFLLAALSNPSAAGAVALLLEPDMLCNAVVGVLGMGLAVPFLAETYSLVGKKTRAVPAADAICLIGGFMLRYVVVMCGTH